MTTPAGRHLPSRGHTTPPSATHQRRWWILAVVSLAQLMDVLDGTIINIALPSAQNDLGFGEDQREWMVTGYALAYGSLLLLGGRLADRFGRRKLFMIGLVGFSVASGVGGAAGNFTVLLAARISQGACAAMLAPAALSLLSVTFADQPSERGRAFSVFGAVSGMGGAIGLVLGGVLTDTLSWRWCLYVNVVISAVALVGALVLLRGLDESGERQRNLDLLGAAAVVGGLFGLVLGLGNSAAHGWDDAGTWLPLAAGALLLTLFFLRERSTARPLLPLSVILHRDRGAAYLGIGVAGVGSFAVFLYLTFYLQQTLGWSALKSGVAFLPFAAALVVGAGISGSLLLPRVGPRPLVPIGCVLSAVSLLLLTGLPADGSYLADVLPTVLLSGAGVGIIFGCAQNVATSGVATSDSGVASAMVNTVQQVGGSIGLAAFTSINIAASDRYTTNHADLAHDQLQTLSALAGYHTVFWVGAGIFTIGAVLTTALFNPGPVQNITHA
ncbi:DHA2 family efflux MFS transporter permease subunit [Nakamurella sp. YIM 132087]|uniref:DHA2 family efflux MFS transporter permease subunit n=1 Tax=Nakamurella alba TaxID=2665158 RepID=A0A7K1FMW4_9ACTN|nr:MFS transporter [Nakamurella alba]MTD14659.1 DHA2 family efflux MFS transporter permease subunit [Nakamurella alba]